MSIYLIALLVFIFCIISDILFCVFSKTKNEEKQISPDLRIWGLGILLGIAIILFYHISPLLKKIVDFDTFPYTIFQIIYYISTLIFLIVLILIFIWAILKISKED